MWSEADTLAGPVQECSWQHAADQALASTEMPRGSKASLVHGVEHIQWCTKHAALCLDVACPGHSGQAGQSCKRKSCAFQQSSSPLVVPPVTLIFVFELLVDDTPLSQMQKSADV